MSLVPGTSNRGWSFYVLCQEAKPKNLQARKNNSPTIFNISNTIGRHTHTHIHTQSPNYLKLHVTLLLTIIGGTWCVSTNHLILMRGCGKGTRCLPHLFPLPPGHSARLHFPAPFAVRCAGEPEFYQWNAECSSPNSLAHINSPTKPSSRPFPPTPHRRSWQPWNECWIPQGHKTRRAWIPESPLEGLLSADPEHLLDFTCMRNKLLPG